MKYRYNISLPYIILAIFAFLSFAILKIKQVNRLKQDVLIESAKVNFIKAGGTFDSVNVDGNSITFYKNGRLQGKTVSQEAK